MDVGDGLPIIHGWLVFVPSYVVGFFAMIGENVVAGSIDLVRDDNCDGKIVVCVFFGVFVVIWLIFSDVFADNRRKRRRPAVLAGSSSLEELSSDLS